MIPGMKLKATKEEGGVLGYARIEILDRLLQRTETWEQKCCCGREDCTEPPRTIVWYQYSLVCKLTCPEGHVHIGVIMAEDLEHDLQDGCYEVVQK